MQVRRHIPNLNRHWHAISMRACRTHVNGPKDTAHPEVIADAFVEQQDCASFQFSQED
jgi:hypothetical protein